MITILLAGNSSRNETWLTNMKTALQDSLGEVYIHKYSHWKTENSKIDFDLELKKLKVILTDQQDYFIVAKSAGAILTIKGVMEGVLTPKMCVFFGTAILWAKENNFNINNWISEYSVPTLFIQKTNDPAISSDNLKDLLINSKVKNYNLMSVNGDTHDYDEYEENSTIVSNFFKK